MIVHRRFERVAARLPTDIALDSQGRVLTYRRLDSEAGRVADALVGARVRPGAVVGIYADMDPQYVVALLGVLKAEAVFMPLDVASPDRRLLDTLRKAEPAVLVTTAGREHELFARLSAFRDEVAVSVLIVLDATSGVDVRCFSDRAGGAASPRTRTWDGAADASPEDGCYLIMTSGSTGQPKAILGSHKGLCHFIDWEIRELGLTEKCRVSALSAPTFDVSLRDIFSALLCGGTVCLPDQEARHNPVRMLDWLRDSCVTVSHMVPTVFRLLTQEIERRGKNARLLPDLEHILLAGEELSGQDVTRWRQASGDRVELLNLYGPSETTLAKLFFRIGDRSFAPGEIVPIGKPLPDTEVLIVDGDNLVSPGEPGEICIQTPFRSKGYYRDDLLTEERFVRNPFSGDPEAVLYKTGDYGRLLPDGNVKFEGRRDGQVKLHGNRVEIGEIEAVLRQHDDVSECALAVKEPTPSDKRLVGYVVPKPGATAAPHVLRQFLAERLPDYMVPSQFVTLESLPRTHSGKIDRQALPMPGHGRPDTGRPFVPTSTQIERQVADLWRAVLGLDEVGLDDSFFDLGGTSVLAARVVALVHERLGAAISIVDAFKHPTVRDFSAYLEGLLSRDDRPGAEPSFDALRAEETPRARVPRAAREGVGEPVAIVGMSGRFPGAPDTESLWRNLCEGVESIDSLADEELDPSIDPGLRKHPAYVRARGLLRNEDQFDPGFFGMSPGEAAIMDPQHRLFLETAWQALEDAGYAAGTATSPVGVFGGTGYNTYLANHVLRSPAALAQFGEHQICLANAPDYLTLRVSYRLNLQGPSVSLYTGCSLSLVAICQAYDSLGARRCDMALAGAAFVSCPVVSGYLYQEGEMFSPDGHCRPFDASARGTVFSNGAGVVVLRRLEDAVRDGDFIYAVIRGVGLNNDGSKKMSFAAPSVDGQAEAVAQALRTAGVEPETIGYVETHGTGTPVGDPIEVAALAQAFSARTGRKGFCGIGSIKGNIGHLDAAAGVAGLIKAALMLHHGKIPPSLNFRQPNPEIDFAGSPFFVTTGLADWKPGSVPRRAGVTSLGVGGTNAHVVLEEAPPRTGSGSSRTWSLLVLSGRTEAALEKQAARLAEHLKRNPQLSLPDVAYTLQVGRKAFERRRVAVCSDLPGAIAALEEKGTAPPATRGRASVRPEVAFMFSGQGAQYVDMAAGLYRDEPRFREEVDRCAEILKPHLSLDVRGVLFPEQRSPQDAAEALKQTSLAQPALFVVEYALARLWEHWGVRPAAMLGHSIGEYVAACLAGVFSLEDALALVARRGRLMQSMPRGAMLAVGLAEHELRPLLAGDLALAAVNGPSLCVASGEADAIALLESSLSERGVSTQRLQTSHAFHSQMMDPAVGPFKEQVSLITLNRPRTPLLSNVTGTWMTPEQAVDPGYWAAQLRETVRFGDCLERLCDAPARVFLEVGPGRALGTLAMRHPRRSRDHAVVTSTRHPREEGSDVAFIVHALGKLWLAGVDVDWVGFQAGARRCRVPLPTYPFERRRCWIDAPRLTAGPVDDARGVPASGADARSASPEPVAPPAGTATTSAVEAAERSLSRMVQDLLGVDRVEPGDNFFDLGGDSMLAVRLFAQIEKVFGKKLPLATLYQAPTPAQLAAVLWARKEEPSWDSLIEIRREGSRPPLYFVHGAGGNVLIYRDLARHLGPDQPIYGLQSQGLDGVRPLLTTVEEMGSRYVSEMRASRPHGPYLLGGYCLGGSVALEMARRLREEGEEVPLVLLFETYNFSGIGSMSRLDKSWHALQRAEFHLRNFLLLDLRERWTFLKEKGKVARGRADVWAGKSFSFVRRKMDVARGQGTLHFDLWEANDRAAMNYVPRPYSGRVAMFVPLREYAHHLRPGLALDPFITGRIDRYTFPAYPAGMMVEPFVGRLAGMVAECVDRALSSEEDQNVSA